MNGTIFISSERLAEYGRRIREQLLFRPVSLLEGNSQTLTAVISMLRDAEYRSSINGSLKESLESFCESLGVIRRDLFIADAEGGQIFAG